MVVMVMMTHVHMKGFALIVSCDLVFLGENLVFGI